MVYKLVLYQGLISQSLCNRTAIHHLVRSPKVLNHKYVNPDNYWEYDKCSLSNDRLEDGPADPNDYDSLNKFVDTSFEGIDQLGWEGFWSYWSLEWVEKVQNNTYGFMRAPEFND